MKKDKLTRCPGCGKHCVRDCVRCKYGKNYFAKMDAKCGAVAKEKTKKRKWEKYVEEGGTVWQLLHAAGNVKKALKSGKASEEMLLSGLDAAQRAQMCEILRKLDGQSGTK